MARIVLTLLVAMNLTFICWGHDKDGHHTDIHISFLGEPDHDHEAEEAVQANRGSAARGVSSAPALSEGPHEGHTFATLGLALMGGFVGIRQIRRSMRVLSQLGLQSQISTEPLDPPPRLPIV